MNWKRNRHLRANGTSTYHGWKYALLGMSVTLISTASAMRRAAIVGCTNRRTGRRTKRARHLPTGKAVARFD